MDLKPGEGAGRVPWKPGLTGPWRVVDVRGHRLTLEPVPDPSVPLPKALMKLMPRIVFSFRLMRRALRPNNPSSSRMRTSSILSARAWASRLPGRPSSWNLLSAAEAEILCSVSVTELRTEVPVAGPRCVAWARSRKSIKLVHRSEFPRGWGRADLVGSGLLG